MNAGQRAKQDVARRKLQAFCGLVRHYRETWGLSPDKEVTLNLWAQASNEAQSAEGFSAATDGQQILANSTQGE